MSGERKYKVMTLLTALLTLVLLGSCLREPFRLKAAQAKEREDYVLKGARVYAEQCVQCHGPRGEGSIGMPLNRAALQVDDRSPGGTPVYERITKAIAEGRAGSETVKWAKAPDGRWVSYTAMAAWGKEYGGPLDVEEVRALALFIMKPEGDQWSLIGDGDLAPLAAADYTPDATGQLPLPDGQGLDEATNVAAKALLRDRTTTQCLNCHFVGTRGAKFGPDLSYVSTWGVDQAFLEKFIAYANNGLPTDTDRYVIPHSERMPVYWSANRAVNDPQLDLTSPVASEGPYFMLRFRSRLTEEQIAVLAKYLLAPK